MSFKTAFCFRQLVYKPLWHLVTRVYMPDKDRTQARALVAKNLKCERRLVSMTQVQLEESSGVSQQTISQIEQERVGVTVDTLAQLARAIGVPLAAFFKE